MQGPRSYIAYAVDMFLLVALWLLFSPRLTGLAIHEWLGLALGLPLLLHLLLSWSWIANATVGLFAKATPRRTINYALNALLFVLIVLEIVSGVMISAIAIPAFGIATVNDRSWRALHNLGLNWTLLLLGLHLAMNWDQLLVALRAFARAARSRP